MHMSDVTYEWLGDDDELTLIDDICIIVGASFNDIDVGLSFNAIDVEYFLFCSVRNF